MFDCSSQLQSFYDECVRLGKETRAKLAAHRDANLTRLNTGFAKLNERLGTEYTSYVKHYGQGSYAMHTLNQHPDNDYDLDEAIIFEKDALPAGALDARKRIADAMKESGGSFSKEPEARTNAVTIWYAEGHHVDFAVYRQFEDNGELVYEHAGPDWKRRNPLEVNEWFQGKVDSLSPGGNGVAVKQGQLRRIVRLVKAFAKSRGSWNLPGGMITSALVVECYRPNNDRDDISLRDTLNALNGRIATDVTVLNPVDPGQPLTSKPEWEGQVRRLGEKLSERLPDLNPLDDPDCDEETACRAWAKFFNHEYWQEIIATEKAFIALAVGAILRDDGEEFLRDYGITENIKYSIRIDAKVTQDGWRPFMLRGASQHLRKDRWLDFSVVSSNVPEPYTIKWKVKNTGDEARSLNQLRGAIVDDLGKGTRREHTKYHGEHYVECYAIKDGVCVAKDKLIVPIGTF